MTDLSGKFENLQEQLATQHGQILAALNGLGQQLASIGTALWAPPPGQNVTLAEVVQALESQRLILNDIHTDTMSQDEKLLIIRDTLGDVHADTMSQDQKLLIIRDFVANIYEVLTVPNSFISQIKTAIGTPTGDATTTILGYLASISSSNVWLANTTGNPNNGMGTIQSLLVDMNECMCADPTKIPTLEDCTDPFTSVGMVLVPMSFAGFSDVVVASFAEPLPPDITFGTTFGLDVDNTELQSTDWTGYRFYVQSSGANWAYNPADVQRIPTNRWVTHPGGGAGNMSFAVQGDESITVFICPPGGIVVDPPDEIECIDSLGTIFTRGDTWSGSYNLQTWEDGTDNADGVTFIPSAPVIMACAPGWTITGLTGNCEIYLSASQSAGAVANLSPGATYTFPQGATHFYALGQAGATTRLCPPEAT